MSGLHVQRSTKVQSVSRALSILEAFAREGRAMSLTELSSRVQLNASTVHRLLSTLICCGFAQQDPETGHYRLGLKAFEVGNAALRSLNIRQIARPYLRKVVDSCAETANLAILDRWDVVYVDQIESPNVVKMFAAVGSRGPAYCTGSGKVLLAHLSDREIERFLREVPLKGFTSRTITDAGRLRRELERIRSRGYALDEGEMEEDIRCAAAPVTDHDGKVVAAVSVSGPSTRISSFRLRTEMVNLICQAASSISWELGCSARVGR